MVINKKSNISKKLKELRRNANLTQEKLAKKMKCSRDAIAKIESGDHKPSFDSFFCWLKACDCEFQVFHTKKERKQILCFDKE